jgi:23S rRNA pseudouridine1911/1915/1917 synthase
LVTYSVQRKHSSTRLDQFLKLFYRKRSREAIKRAIDAGVITVQRNGANAGHLPLGKTKPSLQLQFGDEVLVLTEKKTEPEVCFDYKILFEDESLFIIEKPPRLPVHPAGRYFFNTLTSHLKTQGFKNPLKGDQDFYLVHRIDKDTSGVLALAKIKEVSADLVSQFAKRTTEKTYLAIVKGVVEKDEFEVNLSIGRSRLSEISMKMEVIPESEGGQTAFTSFKVIDRRGAYTLLECYPKTGRQHQIRIHLCEYGHPIVGDRLYGLTDREALSAMNAEMSPELMHRLELPRHALHAHRLRITHPVTREKMEFISELPVELRKFFYGK